MPTIDRYSRRVAVVSAAAPVREAADRMRRDGVGSLVVIAEDRRPIGLLTDRDLTIRVIARAREAGATPVSAVMSRPVVTAPPGAGVEEVLELMRIHGVRRVPLVDGDRVTGIVALDDIVLELAEEARDLGGAIRHDLRAGRMAATARQAGKGVASAARSFVREGERIAAILRERVGREIDHARREIHRRIR